MRCIRPKYKASSVSIETIFVLFVVAYASCLFSLFRSKSAVAGEKQTSHTDVNTVLLFTKNVAPERKKNHLWKILEDACNKMPDQQECVKKIKSIFSYAAHWFYSHI